MTTLNHARRVALALPEATEEDHHGLVSFRVRGKIFATVLDDAHLRVMVDEMAIRAAVAQDPGTCQELYWGKRLACVVVDLPTATPELVKELLTEARARRVPKMLALKNSASIDAVESRGPSMEPALAACSVACAVILR